MRPTAGAPRPVTGGGPVLGDPVEIANAVLFLMSDESRYINGVALSVDNGAAVS